MNNVNTCFILKEYFSNRERFADMMDAIIFQGRGRIVAEDLVMNTRQFRYKVRPYGMVDEVVMESKDAILRMQFEKAGKREGIIKPIVFLHDMKRFLEQYEVHGYDVNAEDFKFLPNSKRNFKWKPVITVVIYCDNRAWGESKDLSIFKDAIPEIFRPFMKCWNMSVVHLASVPTYYLHNEDNIRLSKRLLWTYYNNGDVANALMQITKPNTSRMIVSILDNESHVECLLDELFERVTI